MARITIPTLGQYGVIYDQPPQELPVNAWSDAVNIRFRENGAERVLGETEVFSTPSTTPIWLSSYSTNSSRYWIHAGTNKVFVDDGTTRTDITPTTAPTGTLADRYTGGAFQGYSILNNGVDAPWTWNGSGVMTPLANWQSGCRVKSLRPFGNFLIGVGVAKSGTQYPHMVKWGHPAEPGSLPSTWDETDVTKQAGEKDLGEEGSLIVDQLPLGNTNIVYKESSMWAMSLSGDALVFNFQRLPGSIGALARGCIADTPKGHVLLTPGDVVIHTGQGPTSILTAVMRRWLFKQIDSTNRNKSFVVTNPQANEVWVCYPELGKSYCTKAAVWNWVDNTWSVRSLNNATYGATGQMNYAVTQTWAAQSTAWQDAALSWNQDPYSPAQQRLLMATATPSIVAEDVGATFSGAPYTSRLARTGWSFDDPERVKIMKSAYPRIDASKGTRIQIEFGAQMDMEVATTWSAPVVYTVGSTYKADSFAAGRFLAIRFTSLDNQPWRLRSLDLDVVPGGKY